VILVEQQPPLGVFACDHAGLVINSLSQREPPGKEDTRLGDRSQRRPLHALRPAPPPLRGLYGKLPGRSI